MILAMNSTSLDPNSVLALIQRFVGAEADALERVRHQLESEVDSATQMLARSKEQLAAVKELERVLANGTPAEGQQSVPGIEPARPTSLKPVKAANAPSLRRAILLLLAEEPGISWTRDDLLAELNRRGWGPTSQAPRNTLNSRLFELTKAGIVSRYGDAYALPKKEEVPAE